MKNTKYLDWNLLQTFSAVASAGGLSAAASRTNTSQPLLGSQLDELERITGLSLFDRSQPDFSLTDEGKTLLTSAQKVQRSVLGFKRRAHSRTALNGDIRISTDDEIIGHFLLPRIVQRVRDRHPGIKVDIHFFNQTRQLNEHSSEVLLCTRRPTQHQLHTEQLSTMQLGLYASDKYLSTLAAPLTADNLFEHDIIGFEADPMLKKWVNQSGWPVSVDAFSIRTESRLMQLALMREGAGIMLTHQWLAQRIPGIQQVLPDTQLPQLPCWLACHNAQKNHPLVYTLLALLAEQL